MYYRPTSAQSADSSALAVVSSPGSDWKQRLRLKLEFMEFRVGIKTSKHESQSPPGPSA